MLLTTQNAYDIILKLSLKSKSSSTANCEAICKESQSDSFGTLTNKQQCNPENSKRSDPPLRVRAKRKFREQRTKIEEA